MLYEYMTTAATLQKKTYISHAKKGAYILYPSSFHTMCHVWIRAVQDDDHLSQGFFHSYVRTFFCSQLCLHFLLSHSVLDCPSYRYFLWLFVFILQIVPTFLGVAGSGFWAMFVIQQTNRLMQPLIYIYIYLYSAPVLDFLDKIWSNRSQIFATLQPGRSHSRRTSYETWWTFRIAATWQMIWVNFITTSLFSRTLGTMVYFREIIPKWPNYSGSWNIIIYPEMMCVFF